MDINRLLLEFGAYCMQSWNLIQNLHISQLSLYHPHSSRRWPTMWANDGCSWNSSTKLHNLEPNDFGWFRVQLSCSCSPICIKNWQVPTPKFKFTNTINMSKLVLTSHVNRIKPGNTKPIIEVDCQQLSNLWINKCNLCFSYSCKDVEDLKGLMDNFIVVRYRNEECTYKIDHQANFVTTLALIRITSLQG